VVPGVKPYQWPTPLRVALALAYTLGRWSVRVHRSRESFEKFRHEVTSGFEEEPVHSKDAEHGVRTLRQYCP
jgi:hypothetical protein